MWDDQLREDIGLTNVLGVWPDDRIGLSKEEMAQIQAFTAGSLRYSRRTRPDRPLASEDVGPPS